MLITTLKKRKNFDFDLLFIFFGAPMEIYGLSRQESAKCAEAIVTAIERERFSQMLSLFIYPLFGYCIVLYCIDVLLYNNLT